MEDEPVRAIKRKKDSSMVKMAEAVKSGGSWMCFSRKHWSINVSRIIYCWSYKGVSRPALVVTLPTMDGKGFVFLDVGANADAKAEHLLQYAQLGNIYAQKIRGIKNPSVSLLNIGTEAAKGNSLTKKLMNYLKRIIHLISKVTLKLKR